MDRFVPLTIRDRSRIVTVLWLIIPARWLSYERAVKLARWLP